MTDQDKLQAAVGRLEMLIEMGVGSKGLRADLRLVLDALAEAQIRLEMIDEAEEVFKGG